MSFFHRIVGNHEPDEPPKTFSSHMRATVQKKIDRLPYVKTVNTFQRNLEELHEWWPVLIPFLALIGWHTYQNERRNVKQHAVKTQAERMEKNKRQTHAVKRNGKIGKN
jgi:hypothetical protein